MDLMEWGFSMEGIEMDLYTASALGYLDVVHQLLLRGENVNQTNAYGWTPLMYACCYVRSKIVAYLIENGANRCVFNNKGRTLLIIAAMCGSLDIAHQVYVDQLAECSDQFGKTALVYAIEHGNVQIVNYILEQGVDPNALNNDQTPLIFAAVRGHFTMVQLLLKYGADISICDTNGMTAREHALKNGHSNVTILLERYALKSVKEILEQTGFEKYWNCFQENNITFQNFLNMTETDMKDIGISAFGARRKISIVISDIRKCYNF